MHLLWFIVVCAANSVLATQHNITVDDTNPSISYTGTGWHREAIGAELEGSLHTTCGRASEGSSATFSFTGVAIYYMFTPENCPPKTTLILDGGAPITVTYNPSLVRNGMSVQWGMTNLPNGPHTIVNTGDGADTFARVDAFIYTVDKPDGVSSPPASLSGGSPTSARVSGPEGSITAAKVGISPSGSSPTSPAGSSSTSLAGSSSTSLTGSSSTSSANSSPISDSSPTTRLSGLGGYSARATVGGVVGAVVVLIVLGIYYYLQAPTPAHGHSHEFMFLPPVPIVFRRRQLRDYEIIITLKPDNWDLVAEQPERGFTCKGSTRHDLVVWKAIQFADEKEKSVFYQQSTFISQFKLIHDGIHSLGFGDVLEDPQRKGIMLTDFFSFAPLRTLVKRMDGRVWKHDSRRRPTLKPLVVAHNTATYPVEFALGTFHKTRSDQDFSPFLLIPDVLPGNFCIAPQCADLRVNAYIAQNIQNRQRLNKDLFGVSNADDFTLSYGSTSAAQLPEEEESDTAPLLNDPTATAQFVEEDKEFDAAPEAYLEDEEVDGAPKIISPPLLGEKGTLVSSLDKTTCWRLVTELGALKLKIVSREEKV